MTLTLSTQTREDLAASSAFLGRFDGGSIKFYTAPRPAGPGTAISTQTLLATCALASPAIAAGSAAGVVTFNTISDDTSVDTSGTPIWCRFATSGGTAIMDAKVGLAAADLNFDSVVWVTGGTVRVTSLTLTMGAGTAD